MSPWPIVPLGEVLRKSDDWISLQADAIYKEVTVRLWGKGVTLRRQVAGAEIAADSRLRVHSDQFIISRIDARNGASGIIPEDLDGAIVSSDFPVFCPDPKRLLPPFLGWFSKTKNFVNLCAAASEGTTNRVRLKEDRFLLQPIPLPSLAEQQRMVAQIGALSAKIDEAKDLRQQLGAEHQILTRSFADDVYRSLTNSHALQPLEIGCESVTDGAHLTPRFAEDGVPFIFVGNVSRGYLHFDGCKYVDQCYFESLKPVRKPKRGDVLYSAVGATLGIPVVVDVDTSFCFQRHIAIIRPNKQKLNPHFLRYMLHSSSVFHAAWAATTGSAQPTIPLRAIRNLRIPIPPLDQQTRVVSHLNELNTKATQSDRLQERATIELDAMLPAILDRAFT